MSQLQQQIDQRLDAIDRALLGLLARSERVAMVSQIEARIREATASGDVGENLSDCLPLVDSKAIDFSHSSERRSGKKKSLVAVSSGALGILALVLLFATPITYLLVGFLSEALGEFTAISFLGGHLLVVAVGGMAAIALGITALVRLRNRAALAGHGWAITGLSTGTLPALVAGLVVVTVGLQMIDAQAFTGVTVPPPDYSTAQATPAPVYYIESPASLAPPSEVGWKPDARIAPLDLNWDPSVPKALPARPEKSSAPTPEAKLSPSTDVEAPDPSKASDEKSPPAQ